MTEFGITETLIPKGNPENLQITGYLVNQKTYQELKIAINEGKYNDTE